MPEMTEHTRRERLERQVIEQGERITNLEAALHGLWALIEDLQPPDTQRDVGNMLADHFNNSSKLGGFTRGHFDSAS